MYYKRYQYYGSEGITWTKWFKWHGELTEKKQPANKLPVEYKDETELTPEELEFANPKITPKEPKKKTKK